MKSATNRVPNRAGTPLERWLLELLYVDSGLTNLHHGTLEWIPHLQNLSGHTRTPQYAFLSFYEPMYYNEQYDG